MKDFKDYSSVVVRLSLKASHKSNIPVYETDRVQPKVNFSVNHTVFQDKAGGILDTSDAICLFQSTVFILLTDRDG